MRSKRSLDPAKMNHREFLKNLTTDQKEHLSRRSDKEGLLQLSVHLCALLLNTQLILQLLTFFPTLNTLLLYLLLAVLMTSQGILLVFLFTLLHETTHRTPFRSVWLNQLTGWLTGFILFLPAEWFRHFHLAHHRYTHEPGKDPELYSPKPNSTASYLLYLSGFPVWKSHIGTLLGNATGKCSDIFVPDGRIKTITLEARLMVAAYFFIFAIAAATAPLQILTVWLFPLLMGQPFLRAYLLAEHANCEHVGDMFRNTRTTITSKLIKRLAWNMPYHSEHHAFPSVPFYKLPELHQLIDRHLKVKQDGYWNFNRNYLTDVKNDASDAHT